MLLDIHRQISQLSPIGKFDVFFREIEFELYKRHKIEQLPSKFLQLNRKSTPHLVYCHLVHSLTCRSDEVGNRFRLREVYLAIYESTHSKFTWLSGSAAIVYK